MASPIRIDFSGVVDLSKPIPIGEYQVRVVKTEIRQGPKGDYINWELAVTAPAEFNERRLWLITSMSPAALFRLQGVLEALGESPEALEGQFDLNLAKYVGKTAIAVVNIEEYQGEERNRVTDLLPVNAGSVPGSQGPAQGGFKF